MGLWSAKDEKIEELAAKCKNDSCRLPFDYACYSGGAFGISGMVVINLYDNKVYPGMGKSSVATLKNTEIKDPYNVKV